MSTTTAGIEAIAALEEPVRRRLYEYVAASREPVGRDQAAAATGVSRSLAAFHLDRLATLGLLSVEFRRLSGKSGRGAGRPNKLYRRAQTPVSVQLPERRFDLAADLMAGAIDALGSRAIRVLDQGAHDRGVELGRSAAGSEAVPTSGAATTTEREPGLGQAVEALEALGYEPAVIEGEIRLRNCPFHELAQLHRQQTCGMNQSMIEGVLDGLGAAGLQSVLDAQPGWCCVRVTPRSTMAG